MYEEALYYNCYNEPAVCRFNLTTKSVSKVKLPEGTRWVTKSVPFIWKCCVEKIVWNLLLDCTVGQEHMNIEKKKALSPPWAGNPLKEGKCIQLLESYFPQCEKCSSIFRAERRDLTRCLIKLRVLVYASHIKLIGIKQISKEAIKVHTLSYILHQIGLDFFFFSLKMPE